jgi:YggT family protein
MGSWTCSAWIVLQYALEAFQICLILTAVVSWVPSLRGKWFDYIARITGPVLAQVRRVIPPLGGLDLAFLVVFIVNSWVIRQITILAYQCQLNL